MIFNKHGNESRLAFQELNGNAINSFFHSLFLVFVLFDPANTHLGGGGGEYRIPSYSNYLPRIDSRPSPLPPPISIIWMFPDIG